MSGWLSGKPRGTAPARVFVAAAVEAAAAGTAAHPTAHDVRAATKVSRARAYVLLAEEYHRVTGAPPPWRKAS